MVPLLVLLSPSSACSSITATPVYQVPARLAAAPRPDARPHGPEERAPRTTRPRYGAWPLAAPRRVADDEIDPEMGDPAYDTPVLEDRELNKRRRRRTSIDSSTARGPTPVPIDEVEDEKAELEPPPHDPAAGAGRAAALSGDITYTLPAGDDPQAGHAAQGPHARRPTRSSTG